MSSDLETDHNFRIPQHILGYWGNFYEHRDMLRVQEVDVCGGPQLSIMTYNVFGRCGHKRYRNDNDETLISLRYTVLVHEVGRYNPDIICFQEIDRRPKIKSFERHLHQLGYSFYYSNHNLASTMAIFYKTNYFSDALCELHFYSQKISENPKDDNHCVLFLGLRFKENFLKHHNNISKNCLIVANTHLEVRSSWELKTRQTAYLLKGIREFSESYSGKQGFSDCYPFLAGDFNSTPDTPTYLSLVTRPFSIHSPYTSTEPLSSIEESHNSLGLRAMSLYSTGYEFVDPENCGMGNEPEFSFWGPNWQGLCDYIFMICDSFSGDKRGVDNLEQFTKSSSVKLLALLKMPCREEMNGALPEVGSFPSDHLCMMADVELL